MIKAVVFDMDGVICHTNPDHCLAFQAFFAKRNMFFPEEEYAAHMYGKNNGYIMSYFFGRPIVGSELEELAGEKESMFREIYQSKVKCINGFMEWADHLRQNNIQIGVATSAPRLNLDLISGELGLEKMVDLMLAYEDVSVHKPDPLVYLKSANMLGVLPENTVVFEDSFSGVSAGINAGMKVVGVLSSHTKSELPPCDLYIDNYHGLTLDVLNNLTKDSNR